MSDTHLEYQEHEEDNEYQTLQEDCILQDDDSEYQCAICQDLLVAPVTLLCQHTYCRACIKAYVKQHTKPSYDDDGYQVYVARTDKNAKCPLCRCTIVIPPNDNFLLKDIIQKRYPEQYEKRYKEHEKDSLKIDLRDQIEEEIRNEIFNTIIDDAVHNTNNNRLTNNVNTNTTTITSPYVNVNNRTWAHTLFNKYSTFVGVWCISMIIVVFLMLKLGVSSKTYITVYVSFLSLFVYITNKF